MTLEEKRRKRNQEVLGRMRRGDPLTFNGERSFYPNRPNVTKDLKTIAALYCSQGHSFKGNICKNCKTTRRPLSPV